MVIEVNLQGLAAKQLSVFNFPRIFMEIFATRFETKTVNYWKQWSSLARLMGKVQVQAAKQLVVMMFVTFWNRVMKIS